MKENNIKPILTQRKSIITADGQSLTNQGLTTKLMSGQVIKVAMTAKRSPKKKSVLQAAQGYNSQQQISPDRK
jgi:hypothetical protein